MDPWGQQITDCGKSVMSNGSDKLGVVIGCGNHKGGVSKSSSCTYLAAALGERKLRVLIIDCDPSAGATRIFGVNGKIFAGTYELIVRPEPDIMELAVTEGLPRNVSIIPARTELSDFRNYTSKFRDPTAYLAPGVAAARRHFDVIFLDTPPNAQDMLTISAYLNSDWYLLAAFPDMLSIHGLNEALADIADARKTKNPELEVLGVVVNGVDGRTKTWQEVNQVIADNFSGRAFTTVISRAQAVSDATKTGKTLFQIPKFRKHPVVQQYRQLAAEIHARITNREAFLAGGADAIPKLTPFGQEASTDVEPVVEDIAANS
jgi:chromosome partitioning protein